MNGNLIGAVNTPTLASAPGVWDIEELKLAQQQNTWPLFRQPDPYFEYVSLLLSGETAAINGAQNNTFQDSSTNNFTITRNGNTTQGSFSPYLPNWSNYFDGSGDRLSISSPTPGLSLSTGDFTIEMWVYKTVASNAGLLDARSGATATPWFLGIDASNFPYFYDGTSYTSSLAITLNSWNHVSVVRTSGVLKIFVNGTQGYSASYSVNLDRTAGLVIGDTVTAAAPFLGYISNLRIVKGTTVYTANFTPPTSPLTAISGTSLLTCQSNRFIDNSTNNFTITRNGDTRITPFSPFSSFVATKGYVPATYGGSGYFDGTGDYLQAGTNSNLALGSGDFTIEGWHYCTGYNGGASLYSTINTYPSSTGLLFYIEIGGRYTIDVNGTILQPVGTAALNAWVHWAVVRNGSTLSIYINGTSIGSVSSSTNFTDQYAVIGRTGAAANSNFFLGYLSNIRIVKGTAVYTSAFTPPTSPLTAISNTQLLTNFTNGGIIDSAALNVAETVGNAQVSTSVKKYGLGSYYFDGTGDYLVIPNNVLSQFGSGNLTWEMWINTTSSTQYATLYSRSPSSFSTGMWSLMMNMAGSIAGDVGVYMADYSGGAPLLQTTGVNIRDGNWHHVAVVRNGSSWVLYVDGISRATQTWSGTIATITAATYVGADQFYGRNYLGYISDLRLTNGLARYTANFTPPIASLPTF